MLTRREFAFSAIAASMLRAEDLPLVKSRRKPTDEWQEYPTRTLDYVAGFRPGGRPVATDSYGGRADRKQRATGFFHPAKIGERWWLIDPNGHPYIQAGVCSLSQGSTAANQAALKEKFGTAEQWAARTSDFLLDNGFTGSGGWSSVDLLRAAPHRLVYCAMENFMGGFGGSKSLVHQQSGHLGYVQDAIPVFHPEFEAWCDRAAQPLAATKDDPWLLGHFSDNELPAPVDLLDRHLALDTSNPDLAPGHKAAKEWLAARKGGAGEINAEDREAFRAFVYDRYFAVTTRAIRKHDPHHLCLGPRMHGPFLKAPQLMTTAGLASGRARAQRL